MRGGGDVGEALGTEVEESAVPFAAGEGIAGPD
jgi:hypothetical protein